MTGRCKLTHGEMIALLLGRAEGLGMRGDRLKRDGRPMDAARCYGEMRRCITAAGQVVSTCEGEWDEPCEMIFDLRDPMTGETSP